MKCLIYEVRRMCMSAGISGRDWSLWFRERILVLKGEEKGDEGMVAGEGGKVLLFLLLRIDRD